MTKPVYIGGVNVLGLWYYFDFSGFGFYLQCLWLLILRREEYLGYNTEWWFAYGATAVISCFIRSLELFKFLVLA